jgi:hypothetical protein
MEKPTKIEKKLKTTEKFNMQFLSDLNFTISSEEVWNDLCSHNEKEVPVLPIKFRLIPNLESIGSLLNGRVPIQLETL